MSGFLPDIAASLLTQASICHCWVMPSAWALFHLQFSPPLCCDCCDCCDCEDLHLHIHYSIEVHLGVSHQPNKLQNQATCEYDWSHISISKQNMVMWLSSQDVYRTWPTLNYSVTPTNNNCILTIKDQEPSSTRCDLSPNSMPPVVRLQRNSVIHNLSRSSQSGNVLLT